MSEFQAFFYPTCGFPNLQFSAVRPVADAGGAQWATMAVSAALRRDGARRTQLWRQRITAPTPRGPTFWTSADFVGVKGLERNAATLVLSSWPRKTECSGKRSYLSYFIGKRNIICIILKYSLCK